MKALSIVPLLLGLVLNKNISLKLNNEVIKNPEEQYTLVVLTFFNDHFKPLSIGFDVRDRKFFGDVEGKITVSESDLKNYGNFRLSNFSVQDSLFFSHIVNDRIFLKARTLNNTITLSNYIGISHITLNMMFDNKTKTDTIYFDRR